VIATRRRATWLLAVAPAFSTAPPPAGAGESVSASAARVAPDDASSSSAGLDDATKERFLREGRIEGVRDAGGGITGSKRATLVLDGLEHDAHVQTIDDSKAMAVLADGPPEMDFRDSYRHYVAAYRLDRLLGLGMVPVSVVRVFHGRTAAFTWWVDEVLMDERERVKKGVQPPNASRWSREVGAVNVFNELIYNTDPNSGNLLIDRDWRIWMIDQSRAFKIFKTLRHEEKLSRRCPRGLLDAMRRLDEPTLGRTMGDLLGTGQIEGLLARRDRIVAHCEAQIAEYGEAIVLYDLPARAGEPGKR